MGDKTLRTGAATARTGAAMVLRTIGATTRAGRSLTNPAASALVELVQANPAHISAGNKIVFVKRFMSISFWEGIF